MTNGYDILWTDFALKELENTLDYLKAYWTQTDIINFIIKLEDTLLLLSQNPKLFPESKVKKNVRRVIVAKHNTLYYRIKKDAVEIISLFSHRQSKKKRRLK